MLGMGGVSVTRLGSADDSAVGMRARWRQPIDISLWENQRFPNLHESL
jgi:hypothetical protein